MKSYAQEFVKAMKNQKFANRMNPLSEKELEKHLEQESQGHEIENYNKIHDSEQS